MNVIMTEVMKAVKAMRIVIEKKKKTLNFLAYSYTAYLPVIYAGCFL